MVMLSVIMPMYNSKDIVLNLKKAINSLDKVSKDYEIILVDDGSTNDCFKEAKNFKNKKVKVIGYRKNKGKGNAIRYGFNFTKGNYVAFVDSGRDLNPFQLKKFLWIIKRNKVDIVIGSKRHPNSQVYYPHFRRLMSKTYQIMNRILFNLKVKDTQVGIKLFKRKVLEKIMPKIAVKRFAFDLEFLVLANKYKFSIVEAPIKMRYCFKSSIDPFSVFFMIWDTLAIFYRDKILRYYDEK